MARYISIGSTQKRKFHGIVRADSLGGELLGKLGFLRYHLPTQVGTGSEITVLCQVISVDRRNAVHEDGSFGPVIAAKGNIPYLSGIGDFEQAVMKPLAQQVNGNPAALRSNPPSGTELVSLDDESLDTAGSPQKVFNTFSPHSTQYMKYVGRLVGEHINLPIIMKNFDPADTDEGSWSEGRHVVFLGRQGSGKTHLAKMMLGMYLVSNSSMGALIPDGKGDFVSPGRIDLDLKAFLTANHRPVEVIHVDNIRLEESRHFRALLDLADFKNKIFDGNNEKWEAIMSLTLDRFSDDDRRMVVTGEAAITYNRFLEAFNEAVPLSYAETANQMRTRLTRLQSKQEIHRRRAAAIFDSVLKRFTTGKPMAEIVEGVLGEGSIIFLDIGSFDNEVNVFILGDLYRRVRKSAVYRFHQRRYSNAIIYVDEANRFIPQTPDERNKELQRELIDSIKTTRQYGVGWWFADQRPSSISKDAFSQMGTYFFGRGMNVASDRQNMESIVGEEGAEIYDYVMTAGGKAFVAYGQLVGIGNSESVAIPIESFANWETAAASVQELDVQLIVP